MLSDEQIKNMTLPEYIAEINKGNDHCVLVDDLSHWEECGVTSSTELAEYLDYERAYNMRKESW